MTANHSAAPRFEPEFACWRDLPADVLATLTASGVEFDPDDEILPDIIHDAFAVKADRLWESVKAAVPVGLDVLH